MSTPFSFEHIGLAASDPSALLKWYQAHLGAELVHAMAQTPPAYLMRLGGVLVEIYPADSASEQTRHNRLAGWRHLALRVDSIEAAREHFARLGLPLTEPVKPAGGGGRVLFFSDPEGNLLHLVERLAAGFTG